MILNQFFISICITSYNRPCELKRCLNSIDIKDYQNSVEIVVSEDCSPLKDEIYKVVHQYASKSKIEVIYNSNKTNLGYDCNLEKLISLARGKHILLMSDDDGFIKGSLDKIIEQLHFFDCALAFSPFYNIKKKNTNENSKVHL